MLVNTFISAGCIVLFFFVIRLLISRKVSPLVSNLLLIWILSRFFELLSFYLIETGLIIHAPYLLRISFPLLYAAPASIYLYVNSLIHNRTKLRRIDYLHFIPAVLAFIDLYPWYFSPAINWNEIVVELIKTKDQSIINNAGFLPASFHFWLRPLLFFSYLSLSWLALMRSQIIQIKGWNNSLKIWLVLALSVTTLITTCLFLISIAKNTRVYNLQLPLSESLIIWFGSITGFSCLYIIFSKPTLLYEYLIIDGKSKLISKVSNFANKKENNAVSDSEKDSMSVLADIMLHEKLFLNSEFELYELAKRSNLTLIECSKLINNSQNISVRDWVNKFRIEYFIETYPKKSCTLTVDAIALEAGFSSRATFYRAFKKEKSMMPSEFFRQE